MTIKWLPRNFTELNTLSTKVRIGIAANGTNLGMTSTEVTGFAATQTNYTADYDNYQSLLEQTAMAKAQLEKDRTALSAAMRKYNTRMQASANITNVLRIEIGLPVPSGTSSSPNPVKVLNLRAYPFADGTLKLKWDRASANAYGTQFFIQTSVDGGAFENLTMTLKQSITLNGFAPGVAVAFRIIAAKDTRKATPSDTQWIYNEGASGGSLQVAA